jgi:nucleoside-diphosphate-sugar epimerase
MARICVTGASGRAGRAVVAELMGHGHWVVATDLVAPAEDLGIPVLRADLTDYGQALEALHGADAVVHLANIPAPDIRTPAVTFNTNMAMNFNVFMAAATLRLGRVVWASSETTLGLPFDEPPRYAPVDEDHYPVPTTTYALSKVASETTAGHIAQWSGIPFVALRFSNILGPRDYQEFPSYWPDPQLRKWNLWGYIDERDAAAGARRAGRGQFQLHHRRRGHRDEPSVGGPHARGLPRRAAVRRGRRDCHLAVDRPRPPRPGLRACPFVARSPRGVNQGLAG